MRNYRIRILIENVDKGPAEHSEVSLGTVTAASIGDLVKVASGLMMQFVPKPVVEAAPDTLGTDK